jgi:hypothetical protein
MSENSNICVIIPVHKSQPSQYESVSLAACKQHLNRYDCFLIYPEGTDVSAYTAQHNDLLLKPVNPQWLSSIEQYNKMKLDLSFYNLFSSYRYMLTYELDAYIFNDGLENTNALTFDFIGAPFFEGYWDAKADSPFVAGCNSGFSVRNIASCINALKGMEQYRLHWQLYKVLLKPIRRLRLLLNRLTRSKYEVFITGRFSFYFDDFYINEDVVWTEIIPQLFPTFTVADPMSALKFSFEYNLEHSLQLNGGQLPLGCHAWYKHLDFWAKYIQVNELK